MLISLRKKNSVGVYRKFLASSYNMVNSSELEVLWILKIQTHIDTNLLYSMAFIHWIEPERQSHFILNTFNHRKWKTQINYFGISSVMLWSLTDYLLAAFSMIYETNRRFSIINTKVCQKHFALINLKIFYHFIKSNCMLLGRFQALSDLVGSWLLVTETNGKIRIEIHYFWLMHPSWWSIISISLPLIKLTSLNANLLYSGVTVQKYVCKEG